MNSGDLSDEDREAILELQSSDAESSTDDEFEIPIENRSSHQGSSSGNSSLWKSVANLINYMEGIGFLALPYAIKRGGITILVAFLILPVCAWYTGKLLIECLYDTDKRTEELGQDPLSKNWEKCFYLNMEAMSSQVLCNWVFFFLCFISSSMRITYEPQSPVIPLTMTAWICLAGVVVFQQLFLIL
ncbi:vesicular inhibitory amino acid transporter-like [Montipora capricornis]|uniref:vesicular inhibitory amino acid transporter-like n=1 Tax=Montipora capricornis TaxID=246305 RepID=UPI0035F13A07